MTYKEGMNLCFAWNSKKKCCRCLKITECKNGFGVTNRGICKFYKPRSDESNNQKMREFCKYSNIYYKKGKTPKSGIDKFTDGVIKTIGGCDE